MVTTVGGFPASRGKRELWMRENSRGNYYAGNAGKTRVHKILKIPTKIVDNAKVVFPKAERVNTKINSIKYLEQRVQFKQIINAKLHLVNLILFNIK